MRRRPLADIEATRRGIRDRLDEHRRIALELLEVQAQMSGSLFARWVDCGKEGCACQAGQKHGPYWVLSTRSGGRGGFAYLGADQADEVRRLIAASRGFRDGMKRLRGIGDEVLRLLEKYKDSLAREASRRLSRSA